VRGCLVPQPRHNDWAGLFHITNGHLKVGMGKKGMRSEVVTSQLMSIQYTPLAACVFATYDLGVYIGCGPLPADDKQSILWQQCRADMHTASPCTCGEVTQALLRKCVLGVGNSIPPICISNTTTTTSVPPLLPCRWLVAVCATVIWLS
jgi:hypothetical protein